MATSGREKTCQADQILQGGVLSHLNAEDKQVIRTLFLKYPQLQQNFMSIVNFLDLVRQDISDYETLFDSLVRIQKVVTHRRADIAQVGRFAVASGYVEQAVALLRRLLREFGIPFVTDISLSPYKNRRESCLALLLRMFMSFTHHETAETAGFRLKLAQTGVLTDMVLILKNIKEQKDEELEKGLCFIILAIIFNCCKNPDVLSIVKKMNRLIVLHVRPFLLKKVNEIRVAALFLLAYIVDEEDVHFLKLDHEMLQFCLSRLKVAWTSQNRGKNGWETDELLTGLSLLARLDFNKRLIVSKGILELLTPVLQHGLESEQQAAAATLAELAKDPENIKVFKRDGPLKTMLEVFRTEEKRSPAAFPSDVIQILALVANQCEAESEDNSAVNELLDGMGNILNILQIGKVEFLLKQFDLASTRHSLFSNDVRSREKMLQALRKLIEDDSCKRELLARGGLDLLNGLLQGKREEEQLASLAILLGLTSCQEYCIIIRANTSIMATLDSFNRRGNRTVSNLVTQVQLAIQRRIAL